MKVFYIFYSWNKDDCKSMAISTANSQKNAIDNFKERMDKYVEDEDSDIDDYHIWWIEELKVSDKEQVIIA